MPVEASASPGSPPPEPDRPGAPDAGPSATSWVASDAPPDVGLAGLRAHLARIIDRLGLHSLTVVVDDPDLGRQAFRAGAGTLESGVVAAGPGVHADPGLPPERIDAELLVGLCAASLRVDVLRDTAGETVELALRRLPGVYGVVLERAGDLTSCRLLASAGAPDDLAHRAATALSGEPRLVIELVRDTPARRPETVPPAPTGERTPTPAAAGEAGGAGPVLLAVRSVPEDGEIEAHLSAGTARAVGRAPLSRGLVGAAEAVLAAVHEIDAESPWLPSWVRTVETTASGSFVVAVALVEPQGALARHGIAVGSSPIEAAARATVVALSDT